MPPYKPYASTKQERWAHTAQGQAALGSADVHGKDEATKGKNLPLYAGRGQKKMGAAMSAAKLILAILLLPLFAHATTVTGTVKVLGTPFTGYMTVELSYPASTGTYLSLPQPSGLIPVTNGTFVPITLEGQDTPLLPTGTYYQFSFYSSARALITRLNYKITGANFDIGTAVPTPILTNNISLLDLLGLRSLSVQSLTVLNSFQISNGVLFTKFGVFNAEYLNSVEFAYAFNNLNPSSTSCGIQEAINALPNTGGIVVLQQGACTISATITITKPLILVGFGGGGYLDSSTYTTVQAGTTIAANTSGQPAFTVSPAAAGTLSGVTFKGFLVKGSSATDIVDIGNSSTSQFVTRVSFDDFVAYQAAGCGINVGGNLTGLSITNSLLTKGTSSGLCISAPTGTLVKDVSIASSGFTRNTVDGIQISSNAATDLTVTQSDLSYNSQYGLHVLVGSPNSVLHVTNSRIRGNIRGLDIADGSGYSEGNDYTAESTQLYSAYLDTPTSTNQTFSFKDEIWGGVTADIFTGATTNTVVVYPGRTTPTTSQTVPNTVMFITGVGGTPLTAGTNGYYTIDQLGTITNYVHLTSLPNDNTYHDYALPHAFTTTYGSGVCQVDRAGGNPGPLGVHPGSTLGFIQVLSNTSSQDAWCIVGGK